MAQSTIDEDIARLEGQLAAIRATISQQESFRAVEEGSAQGRFRSEFTDITKLYDRERDLSNRLTLLYSYQSRSV